MKRNAPSEQNFEHLVVNFAWKKKRPHVQFIPTDGLWPMVWLDDRGLGRNVIRTRKSGKRYVIDLSEWGKK